VKIYINNVDSTYRVKADTVILRQYGTFRSDFSFMLETKFTDAITVSYGMEVLLKDDSGGLIWGGHITQVCEVFRTVSRCGIKVSCKGYENILSRRVCAPFVYTNQYAGDIAKTLFLQYLASTATNGDGLLYNSGLFDNGAYFTEYYSPGARLSQVFDDLAASYGGRWWISPNKSFYFMDEVPLTTAAKCVDVTETAANRLTDVSSLEVTRETSEYRNVQTVIGADGVRGEARNQTEINRMKAFGGSGEYANIVVNKKITDTATATAAAETILRSYENENTEATFTTQTDGFSLFDKVMINAPQFGLYGLTSFIITDITAYDRRTGDGTFGFTYKIKAVMSSETTSYRPAEDWKETISQLVGKSDTTAMPRISDDTGALKPENIIAGNNITLNRSGKNITVNSHADINALSLDSVDFTADSVSFTTEDGNEEEFTFTFDGSGRITKLTDSDGREITVSYS